MGALRQSRRSPALLLGLALISGAPGAAASEEPVDGCVECHAKLPAPLGRPLHPIAGDVHRGKGISCAGCHGGDPSRLDMDGMDPARGYVGKPARAEIPAFCGRCHADPDFMRRYDPGLPTDQLDRYWSSRHGQLLRRGDAKVATCVDCHGAHGILNGKHAASPVFPIHVPETCGRCHGDATYMAGYDIPTDVVAEYRRGVHGVLLLEKRNTGAPTCASCHGNHGAYPPGVHSVAGVCGQCHANTATYFDESPHKAAFAKQNLPECVTCHGNHDIHEPGDAMLGVGPAALCGACHTEGTAGYQAAAAMSDELEELKVRIGQAEESLRDAEAVGMEMGQPRYDFRAAPAALVSARSELHKFSPAAFEKAVAPGLAAAATAEQRAEKAEAEAQARRRHLIPPIAVIAVVIVLLGVKLRHLERGP